MIKPAVFVRGAIGEKIERFSRPIFSLRFRNPISVGGDAQTAQSKSGRGDAGDLKMIVAFFRSRAARAGAVERQTGFRVGMIEEKLKAAAAQIF